MPPLPRNLSSRDCVRALEKAGFYFVRQKGSHIVMRRNEPYAQVIVPEAKSLPPGTLRNIIRQANLTVAEFLELL
jgi:predicted RNA binding protein YcfA (HicA-like mRNA interferase family)